MNKVVNVLGRTAIGLGLMIVNFKAMQFGSGLVRVISRKVSGDKNDNTPVFTAKVEVEKTEVKESKEFLKEAGLVNENGELNAAHKKS